MKLGLIGLPGSGKTTLFSALTASKVAPGSFGAGRGKPNVAIVTVADPRVQELSRRYNPKKTIHATIELLDFAGVQEGDGKAGELSTDLMREMRNVDAYAVVVRNFADAAGDPMPPADLEKIEQELILADLVTCEKRLERIAQSRGKGKVDATAVEEKTLAAIKQRLDDLRPVHGLELSRDQETSIRGFQFFTQKPTMAVLNSDDSRFGSSAAALQGLQVRFPAIEFAGNFEAELARLEDPADAKAFMDDMGITESARDRLSHFVYQTMGLISFFTVGEDEVRAWTLRRGASAVEAAGSIHTDLAHGFVRAECFSYDDLIACGSEKALREKGLFRLEGKTYEVRDGDIINIRSSI